VIAGDTIYAEVTVVEARPSASRPGNGVVTLAHSVRKGEGVEVMHYRTTRLIESRRRAGGET
jgi:acyl dehydratase